MSEKLLNTDQAAEMYKVSRYTVNSWINKGWLKAEKGKDGRWYMTESDLRQAKKDMESRPKIKDTGKELLKGDPVLMLVKAIVQDALLGYRDCLNKGLSPYAHEAYLRSKDFSVLTGGLVDPEELIRLMRKEYARRAE